METSNVNNLNGIPNFGHGFQGQVMEDEPETQPEEMPEEEEVEITNPEEE